MLVIEKRPWKCEKVTEYGNIYGLDTTGRDIEQKLRNKVNIFSLLTKLNKQDHQSQTSKCKIFKKVE